MQRTERHERNQTNAKKWKGIKECNEMKRNAKK